MPTPRKPNALHRQRGSYRADRHGADEPDPPGGSMDCPAWVKSDARDHWGEIAPMLEGMGIGSPLYTPALALLVNSLGRYIEYERRVDEVGPTCETEKGNLIVHPVWAARNKAWDQVLKALREFGMTPVAVSRLATEARSKDDHGGIGDIINPKLRIA